MRTASRKNQDMEVDRTILYGRMNVLMASDVAKTKNKVLPLDKPITSCILVKLGLVFFFTGDDYHA